MIVEAACAAGLDLIAITDHNSCENAESGDSGGGWDGSESHSRYGSADRRRRPRAVLVRISGQRVRLAGCGVWGTTPSCRPTRSCSEQQFVIDRDGEFVRFCREFISLPCRMDIESLHVHVQELGGLMIPSHIDRIESGLCGVLGLCLIPLDSTRWRYRENTTPAAARERFFGVGDTAIITNSDAHWLCGDWRAANGAEDGAQEVLQRSEWLLSGSDGRGI